MYRALYRKWRPRTFDDVIGQQQVTETLKHQIADGRASHAYIFVGTRGTGKTTCAKILARALNCEHPENGNPCNKCKSCLGIENGNVMDVVEIDAASNNGVENVRALREEAVYTPASVKKRVYIIDEVHMLSTSAFNALLKILEEPPEHLVFILATTELHKLPPTILSRCQRYSFRRIPPKEVAGRLSYVAQQEGIALTSDAADFLGRLADGSLRDGLSLLDQCSGGKEITVDFVLDTMGLAGNFRIGELMRYISAGDSQRAIELFQNLWMEGKSPSSVLSELVSLLRDAAMMKAAPEGGGGLLSGGFDDRTLDEVGNAVTLNQAMSAIEYIQDALGRLKDGRDPKVTAELCILGLCRPELSDTPEQLSLRISRLEKAVAEGRTVHAPVFSGPSASSVPDVPEVSSESVPPEPEDYDRPAPPDDSDAPPFDLYDEAPAAPVREDRSPEPEPKREEHLEVPAAAPAVPPPSDNSSGEFWPRLKNALADVMPKPRFVHLSDASAELSEDKLILYVTSEFKKKQLDRPEIKDLIIKTAAQLTGGVVPLEIQVGQGPADGSMLDRLAAFGNVEFK